MRYGDNDLVLADIPGIIEGASDGLGMGIQFLKHISRTEGLAYLIDLSDPRYLEAFDTLKEELSSYSEDLVVKKSIIVGTHLDEEGAPEHLAELKEKYPQETIIGICVYYDDGITEVKQAFINLVGKSEGKIMEKVQNKARGGFSAVIDTDATYIEPTYEDEDN